MMALVYAMIVPLIFPWRQKIDRRKDRQINRVPMQLTVPGGLKNDETTGILPGHHTDNFSPVPVWLILLRVRQQKLIVLQRARCCPVFLVLLPLQAATRFQSTVHPLLIHCHAILAVIYCLPGKDYTTEQIPGLYYSNIEVQSLWAAKIVF